MHGKQNADLQQVPMQEISKWYVFDNCLRATHSAICGQQHDVKQLQQGDSVTCVRLSINCKQ